MHTELRRKGVTLSLLWQEFKAEHPGAVQWFGWNRTSAAATGAGSGMFWGEFQTSQCRFRFLCLRRNKQCAWSPYHVAFVSKVSRNRPRDPPCLFENEATNVFAVDVDDERG